MGDTIGNALRRAKANERAAWAKTRSVVSHSFDVLGEGARTEKDAARYLGVVRGRRTRHRLLRRDVAADEREAVLAVPALRRALAPRVRRRPGEKVGVGGPGRGVAAVRLRGRRGAAPAGTDPQRGGGDAVAEAARPAEGAGRGRAGVRPARDARARVFERARAQAPGDGDSRAAGQGRVLGRRDEGGANLGRRRVPGVDAEAHDRRVVPLLRGVPDGQRRDAAASGVRDAQRADGRGRARHGGRAT
jgi:hypothetical protein